MAFFYSLVKPTLRLAVEFYFRDIQILGKESIPEEGPLILAANHPNSVLDSFILGTQTPRRIHYLARSGLFENAIAARVFRWVGAIPIYRAQDQPDDSFSADNERNAQTFSAVWDLLERGGCVGIFPEGANSAPQQVRDLRTGTARMALGAEDRNGFDLGLRIVPVGLTFDQRDRFLTTVLIRFSTPIVVADYRERWESDPAAAVRELTDDLQEAIRAETLHLREARVGWVAERLDAIIGERLLDDLLGTLLIERKSLRTRFFDELRATPEPKRDLDSQHQIRQLIADVVSDVYVERPDIYRRLEQRVQLYTDHAQQIRLRHEVLIDRSLERSSVRRETIRLTVYSIAFGPLAAWGWINNIIPWLAVRHFLRKAPDEAQKATNAFVTGFFAFPLFYALQGFALWYYQQAALMWVILYLLTLPLAGFSWLRYRRQVFKYRDRVLARLLFRSDRELLSSLTAERRRLLEFFLSLASGEAVLQAPESTAALPAPAAHAHRASRSDDPLPRDAAPPS